MRQHYVVAVIAVLLIGLGTRQVFFAPKAADSDLQLGNMNIFQIHIAHPNLPAQKMHDMTFVFDSE
jgi:hypothetical protein